MAQAQVLFSLSSAGGLVTNHPVSMRIQLLVLKSTPKAIHGSAALTDVSESLDPLRSPKKRNIRHALLGKELKTEKTQPGMT